MILLLGLSILLSELMRAGKAAGYALEWEDPKGEYVTIIVFLGVPKYLQKLITRNYKSNLFFEFLPWPNTSTLLSMVETNSASKFKTNFESKEVLTGMAGRMSSIVMTRRNISNLFLLTYLIL